jgi:ribose transport system ATP-binding protein
MTQTTIPRIIQMMIGRELKDMFPRIDHRRGELLMRVEGLDGSPLPRGVSLDLHRGEILGIAGLVGAGRTETLRRIFGLDPSQSGVFQILEGKALPLADMTPRRALRMGVNFLSENRKEEGLATSRDVAFNITLSGLPRYAGLNGWGLLGLRREKEAVGGWIEKVNIKCRGPRQTVRDLSGGNQQKVAIARILEENSDVILLDEPTRGIDVGSKVEIYRLVGRLAAQGKGIIFVSSYLPELLGICDSLAVMHRGAISPIKPVSDWTDQEIMQVATSGN